MVDSLKIIMEIAYTIKVYETIKLGVNQFKVYNVYKCKFEEILYVFVVFL